MPATVRQCYFWPEKCNNAPGCPQQQNKCNDSQYILVKCYTEIPLRSGPDVVAPAKIRIIFNEQQRKRHQNEGKPSVQTAKCGARLEVSYDDKDHHQASDGLNPSLEGHVREIRPKDTKKAEEEIEQNRTVCGDEAEHSISAMDKNYDARDQQYQEESPIHGAAIKLDVTCAGRCHAKPD